MSRIEGWYSDKSLEHIYLASLLCLLCELRTFTLELDQVHYLMSFFTEKLTPWSGLLPVVLSVLIYSRAGVWSLKLVLPVFDRNRQKPFMRKDLIWLVLGGKGEEEHLIPQIESLMSHLSEY